MQHRHQWVGCPVSSPGITACPVGFLPAHAPMYASGPPVTAWKSPLVPQHSRFANGVWDAAIAPALGETRHGWNQHGAETPLHCQDRQLPACGSRAKGKATGFSLTVLTVVSGAAGGVVKGTSGATGSGMTSRVRPNPPNLLLLLNAVGQA